MNTICQDLPQIKPTLWFQYVMTSQGTDKGLWKFLPVREEVRKQRQSGWWCHLLVSSYLWWGKFLHWGRKETVKENGMPMYQMIDGRFVVCHIFTDYTTNPAYLVCSEYIHADCVKYMTLKSLEPRHPERQRKWVPAASVMVGLRWMSLQVRIPDDATGLS